MKMHSAFIELLHEDGRTKINKGTKRGIFLAFFPELIQTVTQWMYFAAECCLHRDTVLVMFSVLLYSTFTVQIMYKLYSLQLNCTYSNYAEAAATCSAAQQHSTFTVQILYKLYSLQLNCTYSNYTEAADTCSATQQHNTFTVQTVQSATELYLQ